MALRKRIGYINGKCNLLTIDTTTRAAYDAASSTGARAQVVLDALANPVQVTVLDENGNVKGTGVMNTPWATRQDNLLIMGELASFTASANGTPTTGWKLRFSSGSRWVEGSFGLVGSGADFTWSKSTWATSQTASLGDVSAYVNKTNVDKTTLVEYDVVQTNQPPVWAAVPTFSATVGVGLLSQPVYTYATDPEGSVLSFGRTGSVNDTGPAGITINDTGLLNVANSVPACPLDGNGNPIPYVIEVYADDGVLDTLPAPVVTLSNVSWYSVTLSWPSVSAATSYKVEQSTDNVTWQQAATVDALTYVASGLNPETQYYFRVRGTNATIVGAYSAVVNTTTLALPSGGNFAQRASGPDVVWAHDFSDPREFMQFLRVTGDYYEPATGFRDQYASYGNDAPFPLIPRLNPTAGPGGKPAIQYRNIGTVTTALLPMDTNAKTIQVLDATDFPDPVATGIPGYQVVLQSVALSETNRERVWVTNVNHATNTLTVVRNWFGVNGVFPNNSKGQLKEWPANTAIGWDSEGSWGRPLAAFKAGHNGRDVADPAATNTVTLRDWNAPVVGSPGSTSYKSFREGYYGHTDYMTKFDTWRDKSGVFDGDEFYLQYRMYISPERQLCDRSGKLFFLHNTVTGNCSQIVGSYNPIQGPDNNTEPAAWSAFHCYGDARAKGTGPLNDPQNDGGASIAQPGSAGAATCTHKNDRSGCWRYPLGEWVTFLMRIKPGHHNDATFGKGTWDGSVQGDIKIDTTAFTPTFGLMEDGITPTLTFQTNLIPTYDKAKHASWVDPNTPNVLNEWAGQFCLLDNAAELAMPNYAVYNYSAKNNPLEVKVVSTSVVGGKLQWVVTKLQAQTPWPNVVPNHGMSFGVEASAPTPTYNSHLYKDTEMEVWVADSTTNGQYALLYSKLDQIAFFGEGINIGLWTDHPPAYNYFQPTAYQNVQDGQKPPSTSYDYMFAEFILSKSYIPEPVDD